MFKKIMLILALMCMIIFPVFSQTGNYTTNSYFYLPEYGAYGTTEYDAYNTAMEVADNQIEANKDSIADENIQDVAGGMFTDNNETFIDLVYQDADGKVDAVVPVKDEDNMSSDSNTFLATQQSIKAYADTLHALQYLKTEIDALSEWETIWSKDVIDSTELAAFTGQENIVTLGTIGTGTWEGTAIADAYIPDTITISDLQAELDAGAHSIGFTVQTITSSAGTATINWGNSNKARITLSENTTLAFTDPANSGNYLLIIIQPAGDNAYTTTFPAGIYWANSTKVTVPTANLNRCIVSFAFDDEDASDVWYCQGTETFATDD